MKRTLLTVWIIVILLLTNLISLYFLLKPHPAFRMETISNGVPGLPQPDTHLFNQPVDEAAAISNVKAFRQMENVNSYGVYYDADTILRYLNVTYPTLKQRMSANTSGKSWKIGFYWMITKGADSVNRLDFCVVPTLVSTADAKGVVDYFNDPNHIYTHPANGGLPDLQVPAISPDNAYDEGQLWP